MKPSIKINITDWWNKDFEKNYFIKFLSKKYNVIKSHNPDFLLCSVFGNNHLKYNCIKIFFTGENFSPDFNLYDYAIGFDAIDFLDRYLRFPLFITYEEALNLALKKHLFENEDELLNRGFCSFVVSNGGGARKREDFFNALSKKEFVASGGRYKNNIGAPVDSKLDFLKGYKFNIAFENSSSPGYVTEKLIEALGAKTVPIYWGDPLLSNTNFLGGGGYTKDSLQSFLNPNSFINLSDFSSIDECIGYIQHIHQDPQAYLKILREKAFSIDTKAYYEKKLETFFDHIFAQRKVSKISQGQFKLAYKNKQKEYQKLSASNKNNTALTKISSLFIRIKNKIKKP